MSIEKLGHHGENFDERVLERIRVLRQKFPGVKISLDGGINLTTAKLALAAGADRLIVGGAIWNTPDPLKTLKEFQSKFS